MDLPWQSEMLSHMQLKTEDQPLHYALNSTNQKKKNRRRRNIPMSSSPSPTFTSSLTKF